MAIIIMAEDESNGLCLRSLWSSDYRSHGEAASPLFFGEPPD